MFELLAEGNWYKGNSKTKEDWGPTSSGGGDDWGSPRGRQPLFKNKKARTGKKKAR